MKRFLLLALFLLLPGMCPAAENLFDIKPVADGVYAAIAKPAYRVNCNAAIILLEDGVLVVDTHSKPSAARALIAQIKKLTDKTVKYVVNTHFHYDHYQGNEAYPSAWPAGIEIISSEATRANIQRLGIPRIKNEIVSMPQEIASLKSDLEKALNAEKKEAIRKNLVQAEAYLAELKTMQVTLPTMTFDRSLILHGPGITVENQAAVESHGRQRHLHGLEFSQIGFGLDKVFSDRFFFLGVESLFQITFQACDLLRHAHDLVLNARYAEPLNVGTGCLRRDDLDARRPGARIGLVPLIMVIVKMRVHHVFHRLVGQFLDLRDQRARRRRF